MREGEQPRDSTGSFPLSEIQQAYFFGRTEMQTLGGISGNVYFELEGRDHDTPRLLAAFRAICARHEMLRAAISRDGTQHIRDQIPENAVEVVDLREMSAEDAEAACLRTRDELLNRSRPIDQFPLFDIRAHLLPSGAARLHLAVDLMLVDSFSIHLLLHEWNLLCRNPELVLPRIGASYRDYVRYQQEQRDTPGYKRALEYWRRRAATLPTAPELPIAKPIRSVHRPRFSRAGGRIEAAALESLKAASREAGITLNVLILTAFAEALAAWSRSPRFTLNLTMLARPPFHAHVYRIVGEFTSLMLVEVNLAAGATFADRARAVQRQMAIDFDHAAVGGIRVMREIAERRGGEEAIIPVVFSSLLQGPGGRASELTELDTSGLGRVVHVVTQTPQVYLDHLVREDAGELALTFDFVEDVLPSAVVEAMLASYLDALRRLAADRALMFAARPTICAWSSPGSPATAVAERGSDTPLIHELVRARAALQPQAPAVIDGDRTLFYGELQRRATILGRALRNASAAPNTLVAIVMDKGAHAVVAMLAILESGAAYLPIDPDFPAKRVAALLADGGVKIVLTQSAIDDRLEWPDGVSRWRVDTWDFGEAHAEQAEPLISAQKPDDLAYVMYTSGSTGTPSGVMISHAGVANIIHDINRRFEVGPRDRSFGISRLSFDLSVYDVFGLLAAGGAVVFTGCKVERDPALWCEALRREGVTIWSSVPALMQLAVERLEQTGERLPDSLRCVMLSGDWIPVTLPDRIRKLHERVEIVSLGGATEGCIWSIIQPIDRVLPTWTSIPYGRALRNQSVRVLDANLAPRPAGAIGELYIGGLGVALGYWRDEEKTRHRFVRDPRTGERIYRTGDFGRYLPDGTIELLGREDLQVKVNGYRVELAEVEAALAGHPSVGAAAAVILGSAQQPKTLVAFAVARGSASVTGEEVLAHARAVLPDYMVPTACHLVAELPLTANGKIDRRALVELCTRARDTKRNDVAAEPSSELVQSICAMIAEATQQPAPEADTDLLQWGINSIQLLRLANALERRFGTRPPVADLFRLRTPRDLAGLFTNLPQEGDRSTKTPLVEDAAELMRFREGRVALRTIDSAPRIFLAGATPIEDLRARRTQRRFASAPIAQERFASWLGALRAEAHGGVQQRGYGSAGGLYPVQAYVHLKRGAVEGLEDGVYYHHPIDHTLVRLAPAEELAAEAHAPPNRALFDRAAFSIILAGDLGAIAPVYGDLAERLCLIEAGLITQLLEMTAPRFGIGLCQIGQIDPAPIRRACHLGDQHLVLHSLVGGGLAGGSWEEGVL